MSDLAVPSDRLALVRRGKSLEYFTLAWNAIEAVVSITAGFLAGSVSLVGFGFDSLIEMTSGGALLWRMHADHDPERRERAENLTLRIVGVCFLVLAAYVTFEAVHDLITRDASERSLPGIVITALSVIVMPLLSRAKRRVGRALSSNAMMADSRQTDFCAYLSAIVLTGLLANAFFGLWWSDAVASLLLVPLITREAFQSLRGTPCSCH